MALPANFIVQRPQCRRFEVVELTVARRPGERERGAGGEHERDGQIRNRMVMDALLEKSLARSARVTTVIELSGIMIAATRGLR